MSKHSKGGILDGLTDEGFVGEQSHLEPVEKRNDEVRPSSVNTNSTTLVEGSTNEEINVEDGRKQIEWMYNKDYDKTNEESLEEYLVGKKSIEKLVKGGDLVDNDYKMMQEQKKAGALFLRSNENRSHETITNDPMIKIKHESLMRMKMYLQNPELLQKEIEKRKKEKKKKEKKEKKEKKKDRKEKKEKKEKVKKRKDYSSDSSYTSYSSDEPKEKKKKIDVESKRSETRPKSETASSSYSEKESSISTHKKERDDKYYRNDDRNYDRNYDREDYRRDKRYYDRRDYDGRFNDGRDYDTGDDDRWDSYYERDFDSRGYRDDRGYRDRYRNDDRREYDKSNKNDQVYSNENTQKQLDEMRKNGQQREQQKQESKLKFLQEKEEILNSTPQSIHNEKATFLQQTRKDTYMNKSFNKR